MKRPYATIALSLVHAQSCLAQTATSTQDSALEEARFPVSRGSNFTFQPSSGSLCYWAVAQYPEQRHEFFNLDSQPMCSPSIANVSTTLLVRFGGRLRPGNVTLTVQCSEPSVWNFLIKDDGASYDGETSVQPVCSENESGTDGADPDPPLPYGNGTRSGHGQASDGLSGGPLMPTPPANSQGDLSFGIPPSLSTLITSFGSVPRGSDWASQMQPSTTAGLDGPSLSATGSYGPFLPGGGGSGWPTESMIEQPTQGASVTSSPEGDAAAQGPGDEGPGYTSSIDGGQSRAPTSAGGAAGMSAPSNSGGPTSSSTDSASPDNPALSNDPASSGVPSLPNHSALPSDPNSSSSPASSDDPSSSNVPASPDDSTSPDNPPLTQDPASPDSPDSPDDPTNSNDPTSPSDPASPTSPASPTYPASPTSPASPSNPVSSNDPFASDSADPSSSNGAPQNNPTAANASAPFICP